MNPSKVIEFSKSSLIGLKTELLRKHEEVKKIKERQGEYVKPNFKTKRTQGHQKANEGVQERSLKDLEPLEDDFASVLQKSREMMLAKSRLYDKLKDSNFNQVEKSEYLIDFDMKRKLYDEKQMLSKEESSLDNSIVEDEDKDFSDTNSDPENDWVDFMDTLGRSRRCLRKDLPEMEAKDAKLAASLRPPSPPQAPEVTPELLSWDMQREMMRKQWEEQETKLLEKKDIHYQDILFNDARPHGVGYFEFSKDENERLWQQQALKKLRGETLEQQEAAMGLKARRQQQLQARLVAAHRRRRERLGLPPDTTESLEGGTSAPEENKAQEKEEKVEVLEETIKKMAPVRPWDIGKQISSVMSQEEWVEQKRNERPKEFAPASSILENVQNSTSEKKFNRNFPKQHVIHNNKIEEKMATFVSGKAVSDGNLLKKWKSTSQENKTSSKFCSEVQRQSNSIDNVKHNTNHEAAEILETNTERESYGPSFKDWRPTSEQIDALLSSAKAKCVKPCEREQQKPVNVSSSSVRFNRMCFQPVLEQQIMECDLKNEIFTENNVKPIKQSEINDTNKKPNDVQRSKNNQKHQSILSDQCSLNSDEEVSSKDLVENSKNSNDLNNFQSTNRKIYDNLNKHKRKWAEIAPPTSMSYYMEGCERKKHSTTERPQLADSIEVGLNYLKTRTEQKGKTKLKGMLDII